MPKDDHKPRQQPMRLAGHAGLALVPSDAKWCYVMAHGAGAGMRHPFLADLAGALAGHRVATVRWEFRYMTEGKRRPDPAAVAEASVRAVYLAARERFDGLPMFAGGKSFGGRMTSRAHASEPLPELAGLIFLGFPLHPPKQPAKSRERAAHLTDASGPLLFIRGSRDEFSEPARMASVLATLGRRATLHEIAGADHGLVTQSASREVVIDDIARTIAQWIERVAG